jgi:acetoacetyl-[acyl-carrier protein] synthase
LSHLPVIVGFGGINSAGRGSFHHAYRRTIIDVLEQKAASETYLDLATLMGLVSYQDGSFVDSENNPCSPETVKEKFGPYIRKNTLLRKMGLGLYDVDKVAINKKMIFEPVNGEAICVKVKKKSLPVEIPEHWELQDLNDTEVRVNIKGNLEFLGQDTKSALVKSGGQLPTGFDPAAQYPSNNHPRGLQLAIVGASDALNSMGIDWSDVQQTVRPEQIGVYAGSAMGQLDGFGAGGYLTSPHIGKRTSSKQVPLSLVEMVPDFINAYLIGNLGYTGAQIGACATTLYSLSAAVTDIQAGNRRVAIVGNAESPLRPEVVEGYRVMGALAEDTQILNLDKDRGLKEVDHARACRPFGYNCGFTLGESAQFFILFDDELALELGAQVHGSIGSVFINADGFKKSISAPGFGNYLTLARALGAARSLFDIDAVRNRSFVLAHGTGTPQNRVTESHGINEAAKAFGIEHWPVSAVKCYVGHSLGPAAGDQMNSALGTWKYGYIPGIFTLDQIAEDVHCSNLKMRQQHLDVGSENIDLAFVNTKGFGGNNATGTLISPQKTMQMLEKKHGTAAIKSHGAKNESVVEKAEAYDQTAVRGLTKPIYNFGTGVLSGDDLNMTDEYIKVPGFKKDVTLKFKNPYPDMF